MVKPGSGTYHLHSHSAGKHFVRWPHVSKKRAGRWREDGQTKKE